MIPIPGFIYVTFLNLKILDSVVVWCIAQDIARTPSGYNFPSFFLTSSEIVCLQ